MLSFLRRSLPELNYSDLMDKLEKAHISNLLFESNKINYLAATYTILKKMAKPDGSADRLTLHQRYSKGKYELAIFEIPWAESDIKFSPLIFDRKAGKIVGIMLPFNELLPVLAKNEQRQIHELSMLWTKFIMQTRFGIDLVNGG
jgi:hypothetical protein